MLGEQIRNIRKSRDFTLKALAEQTGLSIGYISQIERNLRIHPCQRFAKSALLWMFPPIFLWEKPKLTTH